MNKGREESEDREDVDLRSDEEFGWMDIVPVAEFMSWRGMRIDQETGNFILPRTASTSSALLCLIRVSKITICLLYKDMSKSSRMTSRSAFTHGRPKK